jgi:hypothetical protein
MEFVAFSSDDDIEDARMENLSSVDNSPHGMLLWPWIVLLVVVSDTLRAASSFLLGTLETECSTFSFV